MGGILIVHKIAAMAAGFHNPVILHGSTGLGLAGLRDGVIGKVYMARGSIGGDRINQPGGAGAEHTELRPVAWACAETAVHTQSLHYHWRWHWDFAMVTWAIRESMKRICACGGWVWLPDKVTPAGGKFLWDDCKETPEVLSSTCVYTKEKKIIEFEVWPWCTNAEYGATVGNIFYGSEGYMVIKGILEV